MAVRRNALGFRCALHLLDLHGFILQSQNFTEARNSALNTSRLISPLKSARLQTHVEARFHVGYQGNFEKLRLC